MDFKQFAQKYWQVGAIIIVVIIIGVYFDIRHANKTQPAENSEQTNMSQNEAAVPSSISQAATGTESWEGTLENSNNSAKGNLMLVTPAHTIYIRSGRDFSSLIGKKVNVTYQGTLDSFSLENITAE
jgi:hypothetical protein